MIVLEPKVGPNWSMPYDEYALVKGVRQSELKILGSHSPAHLKEARDNPTEGETDALRLGSLIDIAVFEPHRFKDGDAFHLRPDTYRNVKSEIKDWHNGSNYCKAWNETHQDKPIVTAQEVYEIGEIAGSVRAHPAAKLALSQGRAQVSLFAIDPETDILLKCRPDWLSGNVIVDLKSCRDASKEAFARAIGEYGYDVQAAFYLDVAELLALEKRNFVFICVEKEPPWAVAVYQLDEESIEIGRRKYRYWLAQYKQCVETDNWPGYEETIQTISLPEWHKRKVTNGN